MAKSSKPNPFAKKNAMPKGESEADMEADAVADAQGTGLIARKKKGNHMPLNKKQNSIVDRLVNRK